MPSHKHHFNVLIRETFDDKEPIDWVTLTCACLETKTVQKKDVPPESLWWLNNEDD